MAKAALIGNAISIKGGTDDYTNATIASRPDSVTGQGWGRLNLQNFLYGNETQTFRDSRSSNIGFLAPLGFTGDYRDETYRAVDSTKPITIVLAWSDEAGSIGAGRVLRNDLDLLIPSGGQIIYVGNSFTAQEYSWNWANIGPVVTDDLNTAEVIHLAPGTFGGGTFTVRVLMRAFGGTTYANQPFSLYVRNACRGC